jgi:hypothetical protein
MTPSTDLAEGGTWWVGGGDYIKGIEVCLPQVIKPFQNYRGVATTLYATLIDVSSKT